MTSIESAAAVLPDCLMCGRPTDPDTAGRVYPDGAVDCEGCTTGGTDGYLAGAILEALDGKEIGLGPDPARIGPDVADEDYDDEWLDATVTAAFERDGRGRFGDLIISVPAVGLQPARRFRVRVTEEVA